MFSAPSSAADSGRNKSKQRHGVMGESVPLSVSVTFRYTAWTHFLNSAPPDDVGKTNVNRMNKRYFICILKIGDTRLVSPDKNSSVSPKQDLMTDYIFIGLFSNSVHNSVIVEITGTQNLIQLACEEQTRPRPL